jgi:hypothetical protein
MAGTGVSTNSALLGYYDGMRTLLGLVLLLCVHGYASEIVYLKNGDRISGAVEKISDSKLLLKSDVIGEVKIDLTQVARIDSDEQFTVTSTTDSYRAESLTFAPERANVTVSNSHAVSIPRESLQNIYSTSYEPKPPADFGIWSNWSSAINAGMSAARGTSSTTNVSVGFNANRTTDRDRLSLGLNSLFAQNSTSGTTVTSANAIHAATRYDLNVSDNTFTFALANFDSDQLQHLDLRAVFGGGAGVRLQQSNRSSLDVFGGASLNQEVLSTEPNRRSGEFITGQEFRFRPSGRTELSERLMLFPNFTTTGEYRVAFDSTAVLKFNSWLGWQSTLSNMYVSNPAPAARNNDFLITTGIRIALGEEHSFQPKLKMPAFTK